MTRSLLMPNAAIPGLKLLASLTPAQVATALQVFDAEAASDPADLCIKLAHSINKSGAEALDIYRLVDFVSGQLADHQIYDAAEVLPDLETALSAAGEAVSPSLLGDPPKELLELLKPESTWRILRKKHELLAGLVNPIESVRTVCDVRPIFDERREQIRDAGITVTVQFLVTNSEGHSEQLLVTADEGALDKLLGKLSEAQRKVAQIRQTYLRKVTP